MCDIKIKHQHNKVVKDNIQILKFTEFHAKNKHTGLETDSQ